MDPLHPGDNGIEILEVDQEESPPSTPVPSLTIGRVLDLISKAKQGNIDQVQIISIIFLLSSVTTPNINSLISMPFKKRPVKSREQFLGIWTEKKAYVARVGGKGASYQVNKALRRSEEWPWPDASPGNSHQESKFRVCAYVDQHHFLNLQMLNFTYSTKITNFYSMNLKLFIVI